MSVTILQVEGKKIVFADYTACKQSSELIEVLHKCEEIFKKMPNGEVLSLGDFTGTRIDKEFMEEAKAVAIRTSNKKVKKSALLGVVGLKKVFLMGYNLVSAQKFIPFETKEAAISYLIE